MLDKLIKQLNDTTEDDISLFRQYINVLYNYKDISKKDYDYLKLLINDKLEVMLHK